MSSVNDFAGSYTIDPAHSEIGFTARHAMVTKVRGSFTDFTGSATTEEGLGNASISVEIQAGWSSPGKWCISLPLKQCV